jgi:uncharacterized protein
VQRSTHEVMLDAHPQKPLIAVMRICFHSLVFIAASFGLLAAPAAADEPAFDYQPNPAIWKLSDADTTIYMFGTVHALPEKLKWRSPALEKVISEVDELVLETVDKPDEEFMTDKMVDLMLAGMKQQPLLDRVKPENRATLQELIDEIGLPKDYLDIIPTWMVPFAIFYGSADEEGVSADYGVEPILEAIFAKAKKPVSGIEDGEAVNASLSSLSDSEQLVSLDQMLDEIRLSTADSLHPEKVADDPPFADDIAWAKGDISGIAKDMNPATMGPAYYKALLYDRNAAWTEWLVKRLDRPGKMLLAVGSAHLAGDDSVQVLLKSKGLTVERIY